ncbi:ABC transporter substrate-binding protein [Halobellus sp. GM3]|uniref:ABC transporter substrate-binding protein n=1 Tax=Halobellus sp. GM3 TaxID=3458410 RepID=UPI00403D7063
MAPDAEDREAPTRRDYLKYGGAVVTGGLLAGCTGGSDGGSTPVSTGAESETSTPSTTEDAGYSVTMEPMGTVDFEEPPETWSAFLSTYGDMGIALGKAGGLRGLWNPDTMPTAFYDALPGVDVSFADVAPIAEGGEFDKEIFYELDCDVHLIDPNWLGVLADDWSENDAEEVATQVGPFLGNYIRRRGDDWHDYGYYTLYEAFEVVAEAFDETERYEAFATIHDEMLATIEGTLPPTQDRPTVGLVSVNSDFEGGSFYAYPVQDGNNHKQYRDLEMRGAFDDHIEGSYAEWDYEQLLEVDPDAIVFQYGFSHVSTSEFESRMESMREDPIGSQLSAVQNDRLYRGGGSYQGPVINLFQTEAAARQFYPDSFGEWDGMETLHEDSLTLFDPRRVADIINGTI